MSSDVPASLRQLVAERAVHRCEYCLLPQAIALHQHEPDHIAPRQHSGETHESNLALANSQRLWIVPGIFMFLRMIPWRGILPSG